jgi:carbamoyl-phosphate synthase large subunit
MIAGSKGRLYEHLRKHDLVPEYFLVDRDAILDGTYRANVDYPVWVRDISIGSAGGKGALLVRSQKEMNAWVLLNAESRIFMISEFLPGRNLACQLLFVNGRLVKHGSYERLEYFLGRMIPSGISGNISRGRLLNDDRLLHNAVSAVLSIASETGEIMNGFVAVDMREDRNGNPLITEINLRHVACTSAFAQAGHNLAEAQLLATLGRAREIGPVAMDYPEGNLILRDIDGPPIWVRSVPTPRVGAAARAIK